MPPSGYFILSANGNNISLLQRFSADIEPPDGLSVQVSGQVIRNITYWFVQAGSYQIQRGNGQRHDVKIRAVQTATLG